MSDTPTTDAPTEMSLVVDRLFPVDGAAHAAKILGMQKRSADRMCSGYSTTPPRILEKLQRQAELKVQFVAGLETLIQSAQSAGVHPHTIRYVLYDLVKGGRLDDESEPI